MWKEKRRKTQEPLRRWPGALPFGMGEADSFLFSMIFGAIGMGYFVYGKSNARLVPLLAGLALCAFPYFISNFTAMIAVGVALTVVPVFFRTEQ
jgi:hypothetical protein